MGACRRKGEIFLQTVLQKQQASDNAQNAQNIRARPVEAGIECCHRSLHFELFC
jgi:hypothetical protein